MDTIRAKYLLEAYHTDSLNTEEYTEFVSLLNDERYTFFRNQWLDQYWLSDDAQFPERAVPNGDKILLQIQSEFIHRKRPASKFVFAAAIAILVLIGGYFLKQTGIPQAETFSDVEPGKNMATLEFSDGHKMVLSDKHQGIVMGSTLAYTDGAKIEQEHIASQANQLISLTVPKKGTYKVVLVDGTEIWLNSDSRISYPSRFEANKRVVSLQGEAYFKVAKISRKLDGKAVRVPFLVKTKNQTVEVLGTEFNVAAYPDDREISTSLVEGKVKVIVDAEHMQNGKQLLLKPGQTSTLNAENLTLNEGKVSQRIAWKDGFFDFSDMDIEQVMRQLGRWYDLDIVFEGKVPEIILYGTIERNNRLSTIMMLLETNGLSYRMDGKLITIFSNKRKGGKK